MNGWRNVTAAGFSDTKEKKNLQLQSSVNGREWSEGVKEVLQKTKTKCKLKENKGNKAMIDDSGERVREEGEGCSRIRK